MWKLIRMVFSTKRGLISDIKFRDEQLKVLKEELHHKNIEVNKLHERIDELSRNIHIMKQLLYVANQSKKY